MARTAPYSRAAAPGRAPRSSRLAWFGRRGRAGARSREDSEKAPAAEAGGGGRLAKARSRRRGGPFRSARAGAAGGARGAAAVKRAAGKTTPAPPRRRHVLPLPVRMLAMLGAFVFMVAFAVVLAKITLAPSPASVSLAHSNLHPGRSIRAYLDQPELRDAAKQIGGNILLGVPFGVLVPVLAPGARGIWRVLLLTATVMLLVEMAQGALVTGRAFDVDDVILNTTGALVGYLLMGRRLGRVHDRRRSD
ncbi:Glycopeptide antibiotics resistance protein [Streptomyces misionensis]|uniref:Glycopeptide antibiotics resistance protein n=1 Tax=Streptomyces misionensis TaxID=67331 RepID=A0A1H4MI32_9ACTN|nr:Glycopeptide antibiotics resistance protein [Streptomyces misionensis]